MTESKELLNLETLKASDVYYEGGIEQIIAEVKEKAFIPDADISTSKGRELIASVAYKVARSKTALDEMGKELVSDLKKKSGAIDAMRRTIRDSLDAIKDEVRKPLTDWEDAEKERISLHQRNMQDIRDMLVFEGTPQIADIETRLKHAEIFTATDFQEFQQQADTVRENTINRLSDLLAQRIKQEDEAAELERLRAESAARAAQDAELARQRAADDRAKAESDAQVRAAEATANARVAAAEQAVRDQQVAIDQAAAQEKALAAQTAAADKARAEDIEHRKKINNEALDAVKEIIAAHQETGLDPSQAIIAAIARGKIPHVSIKY